MADLTFVWLDLVNRRTYLTFPSSQWCTIKQFTQLYWPILRWHLSLVCVWWNRRFIKQLSQLPLPVYSSYIYFKIQILKKRVSDHDIFTNHHTDSCLEWHYPSVTSASNWFIPILYCYWKIWWLIIMVFHLTYKVGSIVIWVLTFTSF